MAIDYSLLALPKSAPGVVRRKAKHRKNASAWRKTAKAVDARDRVDEAPRCFITGKRLQTANPLDPWTFRDRAHVEARSKAKNRRHDVDNVISVSRAVHDLIDKSALLLLDKRGREATSIQSIDHVAWNRRWIAKGEEPCRVRKGLPVIELGKVHD